jgi:hypothetical protein
VVHSVEHLAGVAEAPGARVHHDELGLRDNLGLLAHGRRRTVRLVDSWFLAGGPSTVARAVRGASQFLKLERDGGSLRERHDWFLEEAMAEPGGGLR